MISQVGKNAIAELIDGELTNGKLGTGTTTPSVSDTDLVTEVTSTIDTLVGVQSNNQIVITYSLDSVTGNGNTYTEYGNFFTTSETLLNRITFTGVPKNSAIEFQVNTIVNIL